jgi:hypothetical protein
VNEYIACGNYKLVVIQVSIGNRHDAHSYSVASLLYRLQTYNQRAQAA